MGNQFLGIASSAVRTMQLLHEKAGWLHMDIKPGNMLLRSMQTFPSENGVVLCDFEHARPIELLLTKNSEPPTGTIQWRSIRQDRVAVGDKAAHPVPSWYDDLEALGYT